MINVSNPSEYLDLIFNKGYVKKCYLYEGKLYKTVFLDPESGNIIGRRIEPHVTLKFLLSVWFHTSAEWGAVINSSVTLKEEKFSFNKSL